MGISSVQDGWQEQRLRSQTSIETESTAFLEEGQDITYNSRYGLTWVYQFMSADDFIHCECLWRISLDKMYLSCGNLVLCNLAGVVIEVLL